MDFYKSMDKANFLPPVAVVFHQYPKAVGLRWPFPCILNLFFLKRDEKGQQQDGAPSCLWELHDVPRGNTYERMGTPLFLHPPGASHYNIHTQSPAVYQISSFIFPFWRLLPQVSKCLDPVSPGRHLSIAIFWDGWWFFVLCSLMGSQKSHYFVVSPSFFLL